MQIWKFQLPLQDEIALEMPENSKILSVQTQDEIPCIWANVEPSADKMIRHFKLRGTGFGTDDVGAYVGTFQLENGSFVFHLFEA